MARNHFALLDGDVVATGNLTGPFRACPACGCKHARIDTRAPGIHPGQLLCAACDGHVSWLGRDHLVALLAQKRGAA